MQTEMLKQPETDYSFMDDPVFIKRFDEAVAVEQAQFDAWLTEDAVNTLVDTALDAGRAAFKASEGMAEEERPRWTLALIDLGHRRAKPLVQALMRKGIGHSELLSSYTWDIGFTSIVGKRGAAVKSANTAQMDVTVEAFALALSKPGFEIQIWRDEN